MTEESPALRRHMIELGNLIGQAARTSAVEAHLRAATAATRSLFDAAACSCALLEADGEALRFVAADGAGADAVVGLRMGTDRGIAGWVAVTGQAIVVADVRRDARFARDVAEETQYVPTSIMAAPLLTEEGDVLGVVEVLDRTGGEGTGRDLDVLALIAGQLAAIVGLAAVYDRLGAVLTGAMASGATDEEGFDRAVADGAGDDDLGALARTFAELSAVGPRGRALARQVLDAVLGFTRSTRR